MLYSAIQVLSDSNNNVTKLTGSELVFNADLMIVKATYTLQRDK